ncbi:unnamed protein product [Adineta steineri]|uniref:C2H2-type domain-containing protein n=1 Tax=Adineta steineri TaxID=433720 RepID=A0A814N0C8_9BILA|nr:unnamed protein product [Adineta steineri]CAF1174862.1 unnamed protein product [Adineta steineri]
MQNPSHIIQRLREKFVHSPQSLEIGFDCYKCDTTTISRSVLAKLHHANVRIIDVPDHKPGAVDRRILLDLDRFERVHRPPATIVFISSDIDYVGKLNDLRHQVGYYVVVIHNKPVSEDLWTSINAHYLWDMFTKQPDSTFIALPMPVSQGRSQDFRMADTHQRQNSFLSCDKVLYEHPPSAVFRPRGMQGTCTPPFGHAPVVFQGHSLEFRIESPHQRENSFLSCDKVLYLNSPPDIIGPRGMQGICAPPSGYVPVVSSPRLYQCPDCPNEFRTLDGLHQHQDAKDHRFECPVCDDTFYTLKFLNEHQEDENHFLHQCNRCHRTFQSLDSLTQHKYAKLHF